MSNLNFVCPKCGRTVIETRSTGVTSTDAIRSVHPDGTVIYTHDNNVDGYLDCYQCASCGEELPGIESDEQLVEYLKGQAYNKTKKVFVQVVERSFKIWAVEVPASASDEDITERFWNENIDSCEPRYNQNLNSDVDILETDPDAGPIESGQVYELLDD